MPLVDGCIELHSRIAADPCAFGDLAQKRARVLFFARFVIGDAARPPLVAFQRCVHEFIAYPNTDVFILIHHRTIRLAIVAPVVTVLDQRPRFPFFLLFRINELFDVRMPILERVHLRRASRFAAALHDVRDLIVNLQKREWPAGLAAAAQFFSGRSER